MTTRHASSAPPPKLSLWERLTQRACEFDFFQAVWLFERFWAGDALVGQRGPVARERLRFRPDVAVSFPATDLCRFIPVRRADRDELFYLAEVAFLGLYGVSTPLPLHYAISILRSVDTSGPVPPAGPASRAEGAAVPASAPGNPVRDFIDIFHHRIISLFYRSWLKYRYERMFAAPQRDAITEYLRLLCGCPPGVGAGELGVQPLRMLRYAGVLTQHPRSAGVLAGLLSDYWGGLAVQVRQFVGQWVPLEAADQNRFGQTNCRLGEDLVLGEQVYDLGGTFTISVGPVDWKTYLSFVPGGECFEQTCALARLYCCDPLAFKIETRLKAGEVPPLHLTSGAGGAALGHTSWVRTAELGETATTFDAAGAFRDAA